MNYGEIYGNLYEKSQKESVTEIVTMFKIITEKQSSHIANIYLCKTFH